MYCLKPDNKVNGVKAVSSPETTGLSVFSEFLKIRKNRKAFEKLNIQMLKNFQNINEEQQAEIEMAFFKAIKKLEKLVPAAKEDINKNKFSINSNLFNYELGMILKLFKSSQKRMSEYLYPDRTSEISSNPVLYQKLVDAWGNIPND